MSDLIQHALSSISSHIPARSTVVVGMSGGVDSSVAAALLKEKGFDVVGLLMKNWGDDKVCSIEVDAQDVAHVADILHIPFYTVNFTKEYKEKVFARFLEDLKSGLTPNPDILCNREIKFNCLLQKALSLGAQGLATGHYATNTHKNGEFSLCRSLDQTKDQTYFLYTATQQTLAHTLFPLAQLKKSQIRDIAHRLQLPVAHKKDSTGICFIGERNFRDFIQPYLGYFHGKMRTPEGLCVGEHIGLAYYTLGQRRGLQIGGKGDAWFVVGKEISTNTLIVAQGENHPALFSKNLIASEVHWIGPPPQYPYRCTAKIRYRQEDTSCLLQKIDDEQLFVEFDIPQRAVTPGQSIVFYADKICLGGAIIQNRKERQF